MKVETVQDHAQITLDSAEMNALLGILTVGLEVMGKNPVAIDPVHDGMLFFVGNEVNFAAVATACGCPRTRDFENTPSPVLEKRLIEAVKTVAKIAVGVSEVAMKLRGVDPHEGFDPEMVRLSEQVLAKMRSEGHIVS
jgi:hypothetical protein